jgi:hypothetical protein
LIYRKGLEQSNPTCLWQVGHRRLDGDATLRFACGKSATSPFRYTQQSQIDKHIL